MSRQPELRYRTVFISDTHLGSRGCRAEVLSRFLKHAKCDRLYLVGDILDIWRLRQKWYWPGEHNQVLRQLFQCAKEGTEVIFIPGNHDESVRQFLHADFGGIKVLPYAIHHTIGDRPQRLLVTHGDQFDLVVRHSRFISMIGAKAYEYLIRINAFYNACRIRMKLPQRSLSKAIKLRVKGACMFISRFEEAVIEEARERGFDGVICGHIHQPEVREAVGPTDVSYFNCGDWIEGNTAIVEDCDGSLRLIDAEDELALLHLAPVPARVKRPRGARLSEDALSLESLISFERIFDRRSDEKDLTFR